MVAAQRGKVMVMKWQDKRDICYPKCIIQKKKMVQLYLSQNW